MASSKSSEAHAIGWQAGPGVWCFEAASVFVLHVLFKLASFTARVCWKFASPDVDCERLPGRGIQLSH